MFILLGILAVICVAIWMGGYEDGGYAWSDNPEKQFHYHPTLMVIGLIFLQGEAMWAFFWKQFYRESHNVLHRILGSRFDFYYQAGFSGPIFHRSGTNTESGNKAYVLSVYCCCLKLASVSKIVRFAIVYPGFFVRWGIKAVIREKSPTSIYMNLKTKVSPRRVGICTPSSLYATAELSCPESFVHM